MEPDRVVIGADPEDADDQALLGVSVERGGLQAWLLHERAVAFRTYTGVDELREFEDYDIIAAATPTLTASAAAWDGWPCSRFRRAILMNNRILSAYQARECSSS